MICLPNIQTIALKTIIDKGYIISDNGNVYNPKGKQIVGRINNHGYKISSIKIGNRSITYSFHRLQAYKKFGMNLFNDGIMTRHLNNNKLDNSIDNIEIGSSKENQLDIPEKMRKYRSRNNGKNLIKLRKYTDEIIKKIKNLKNNGLTYKEISQKLNIPIGSVPHIIKIKYKSKL